jgi:hypothetical protein
MSDERSVLCRRRVETAGASAYLTSWSRCSGSTRRNRTPSGRLPGSSGTRAVGCSPRPPGSRSTLGRTTTSGSGYSGRRGCGTAGCTTPGTPRRPSSCFWACLIVRSSASWAGPTRRWRSGTSTSPRRCGAISRSVSAAFSGSDRQCPTATGTARPEGQHLHNRDQVGPVAVWCVDRSHSTLPRGCEPTIWRWNGPRPASNGDWPGRRVLVTWRAR